MTPVVLTLCKATNSSLHLAATWRPVHRRIASWTVGTSKVEDR